MNARKLGLSFCTAVLWLGGLWFVDVSREILENSRWVIALFLCVTTATVWIYAKAVERTENTGGRICIAYVCPSLGCGVFLFFYVLFELFGFADPLVGPVPLTTSILEALWIAAMGAVMLPVIGFSVRVPLALLTVYSLKWFERMMAYFDDGAPEAGGGGDGAG